MNSYILSFQQWADLNPISSHQLGLAAMHLFRPLPSHIPVIPCPAAKLFLSSDSCISQRTLPLASQRLVSQNLRRYPIGRGSNFNLDGSSEYPQNLCPRTSRSIGVGETQNLWLL